MAIECAVAIFITTVIASLINGIKTRDITVLVDDAVNISCFPNAPIEIQWHHITLKGSLEYLYAGSRFFDPYKGRFHMETDPSIPAYFLIIPNVSSQDAGLYRCSEDTTTRVFGSTQLTVLHSSPVCKSNMKPDGFVGPNTCDLQQENMTFYCVVSYDGIPPHLIWRSLNGSQYFNNSVCETSSNERNCKLTLRSDPLLDGTILICEISASNDTRYACQTEIIKIQYIIEEENDAAEKKVNDELECKIKSSQNLSFAWKLRLDNKESLLSTDKTISIQQPGHHKCEVEYSIRNFTCSFLVFTANISAEDVTLNDLSIVLLGTILTIILAIVASIVGIISYMRKRRNARNRASRTREDGNFEATEENIGMTSSEHLEDETGKRLNNSTDESSISVTWQSEILRNIDTLHLGSGILPGRIVVFGQSAEPILTGRGEEDVAIAAAELGKGRIICASHSALRFLEGEEWLQTFHDNVKNWLTRGTFCDNNDIIDAQDKADEQVLASAKVIVWFTSDGKITPANMEAFIRKGGGFFHCVTPWGWKQTHKGRSISDIPYHDLLIKAGICYTDEYIEMKDNCLSVNDNKANGAHLLRILTDIEKHPEKIDEYMINRLKHMPKTVVSQLQKTKGALSILWQSELLRHMDSLIAFCNPGRISVVGHNAVPILTGIGEDDVLVAAAELGKGRIVCASHDDYCKNFQEEDEELRKFHKNVKLWLTRETFNENAIIISAEKKANEETLKSAKIIFYSGGPGNIDSTELGEFIRNGGGLFHCMSPQKWLQSINTNSLMESPYYSLLREAGICYNDDLVPVKDGRFFLRDNKAARIRSLEC